MSRLKVNEGAMDNAESVYSAARLRYSQSLYWLADCFILDLQTTKILRYSNGWAGQPSRFFRLYGFSET